MAVIPSGTSEPWFWAAREAAANDALARLFISLAAKREEHQRNEALREKLRGQAHEDALSRMDVQQGYMLDRLREAARLRQEGRPATDDGTSPGILRGGSTGIGIPTDTTGGGGADSSTTVVPPAVTAPPPSTIPGATPLGPGGDSFSQADDGMNAMAQALPGQAGQPRPIPRGRVSPTRPTTQLPNAPSKRAVQAMYEYIDPKILSAWDGFEKKYGIPQGMLLTLMGAENNGGRQLGKNGYFGWSPELLKVWGLTPQDTRDPVKMGEYTARNMRRNIDAAQELSKTTPLQGKLKVGSGGADIMDYAIAHYFGETDAPYMINARKIDGRIPMTSAMRQVPGRDNARALVGNNLPSNASVNDAYNHVGARVNPWFSGAVKSQEGGTTMKPRSDIAPPAGGGGDVSTFQPTGDSGAGDGRPDGGGRSAAGLDAMAMGARGLVPKAQAFVAEVQDRFPNIKLTSTVRHGNRASQHYHGTATDWSARGASEQEKRDFIEFARYYGAGGLGTYNKEGTSFHVDFRGGTPVAWGPDRHYTSIGQTPRWFQQVAAEHRAGRRPSQYAVRPPGDIPQAQAQTAGGFKGFGPQRGPVRTEVIEPPGEGIPLTAEGVGPTTVPPPPTQVAQTPPVVKRPPKPSEVTPDVTTQFGVKPSRSMVAGSDAITGAPQLTDTRSPVEVAGIPMPPPRPTQTADVPLPPTPTFDPSGTGYDYQTAKRAGLGPDATGHYPSRDPRTGQILKGAAHPTFGLTKQAELAAGYEMTKGPDGKWYSQPITWAQEQPSYPPAKPTTGAPIDPMQPDPNIPISEPVLPRVQQEARSYTPPRTRADVRQLEAAKRAWERRQTQQPSPKQYADRPGFDKNPEVPNAATAAPAQATDAPPVPSPLDDTSNWQPPSPAETLSNAKDLLNRLYRGSVFGRPVETATDVGTATRDVAKELAGDAWPAITGIPLPPAPAEPFPDTVDPQYDAMPRSDLKLPDWFNAWLTPRPKAPQPETVNVPLPRPRPPQTPGGAPMMPTMEPADPGVFKFPEKPNANPSPSGPIIMPGGGGAPGPGSVRIIGRDADGAPLYEEVQMIEQPVEGFGGDEEVVY